MCPSPPPPGGTGSGGSSPLAAAGPRADTWLGMVPPAEAPGPPRGPRPGSHRVSAGPQQDGPGSRSAQPCAPRGAAALAAHPQPGAVTFQPPDSGRAGRGAGGGAGARLGPGGGTRKRPPRPEPPCNRRRPEQSGAGPGRPARHGGRGRGRGLRRGAADHRRWGGVARGAGPGGAAGRGGACAGRGSFASGAHSQPDRERGEGERRELRAAQGAGHGR